MIRLISFLPLLGLTLPVSVNLLVFCIRFMTGLRNVVSYAGSKDHTEVQGEILEGLVARIVSHESSNHMEGVLRDFPSPLVEGGMLVFLQVLCFRFFATSNWDFYTSIAKMRHSSLGILLKCPAQDRLIHTLCDSHI